MKKIFESKMISLDFGSGEYAERVIVYEFDSIEERSAYEAMTQSEVREKLGLPYDWFPAPGAYFERTDIDEISYSHLVAVVRGAYNV